jgi:hypothetical protein
MQGFNEFSNNKEKEKLQIDIFDGLERIPFNPPSTKSK